MITPEQAEKILTTADHMVSRTDELTAAEIVAAATGRWSDIARPPAPADDTSKEN